MKEQLLYLQPADAFFFRNHQAFNGGEDVSAVSLFPPHPTTVYGALRSGYIFAHGGLDKFFQGALTNAIGTPEGQKGNFQLKAVFLHHQGEIYVPLPRDFQVISAEGQETANLLSFEQSHSRNNSRFSHHLYSKQSGKPMSPSGKYIPIDELHSYLLGQQQSLPLKITKWVTQETKTGNALERSTRTTAEHMLYKIHQYRFADDSYGFVTWIGGTNFSEVKKVKMGGKGKLFSISHAPKNKISDLKIAKKTKKKIVSSIRESGLAKIYLATPTIWDKGWFPEAAGEDPTQFFTWNDEISLRWKVATYDRPQLIGGWDIENQRPKPRVWAMPAGTVIYIELENKEDAQKFFDKFNHQSLSDSHQEQGFGLAYVGIVSEDENIGGEKP